MSCRRARQEIDRLGELFLELQQPVAAHAARIRTGARREGRDDRRDEREMQEGVNQKKAAAALNADASRMVPRSPSAPIDRWCAERLHQSPARAST